MNRAVDSFVGGVGRRLRPGRCCGDGAGGRGRRSCGPDAAGVGRPGGAGDEFSAGITSPAVPSGIVAGPDGNLWFTENPDGRRIGGSPRPAR